MQSAHEAQFFTFTFLLFAFVSWATVFGTAIVPLTSIYALL